MATHKRQQIREAVQTLLLNQTDAEDRVYRSRSLKFWESELPAIAVYTRTEDSEVFDESPRRLKRNLNLTIEALATASDDIDDDLDTLTEQIEKVMRLNFYFGLDFVNDQVLTRTELEIRNDGRREVGAVIMTYQVPYLSSEPEEGEPDLAEQDLEKIHLDWEQPPPDQDQDAEDDIEFTS